jgi:signal transduction histidine kinase
MSSPADERARAADTRPAAASPESSTGRPSLLDQLRDANEQLVISSMRTQDSLADRLGFETVLSSLSDTFSRLPVVDFDRAVQSGLRQIVAFLEVDGASVIEFSRNVGIARSWGSAEWMDVGDFPWMTARLQHGHVVDVSELETLPAEAVVDRQSYLAHRVKPQLAVPLHVEGAVVGGLVLSTGAAVRARSDELLPQLHLLGEVFAHALARKQGELEMQRLQQELTHVGRVSVLGEFAASLAHELNQPLTAIVTNAHVALRVLAAGRRADLEELRELLKDIETDGQRAGDMIRRLRGLIKRDHSEFSLLDLNAIVGEVAALVRNDAVVRNVSLRLELAAGLPNVRGDRIQLQQVLLNLVLNGLDAMPDSWTGQRTLVIRTAKASAAAVTVAVEDSGLGIADRDMDHIFDPLYTTKPAGLGMGLAIARRIVDVHGGRLDAANNVHGGTTFQFTLPAATEAER